MYIQEQEIVTDLAGRTEGLERPFPAPREQGSLQSCASSQPDTKDVFKHLLPTCDIGVLRPA